MRSPGKPTFSSTPAVSNLKMRILGVDTALRTTGFGILDTDGRSFQAVDCGVIKTTAKEPLSECLRRLAGGVRELVKQYAPDVGAIEGAFFFQNARTALVLGSARGAVIATLAELAIPMYEYSPRKMKQAVCGHGNASKEQVALLVSQVLGISVGALPNDATDALGLAICHAQTCVTANGLMTPDPL
ncbi:MAG: crossover junction endodeoxyribonuclease RuvC [Lentisphaerae bacterium]|nr:crossover junction endodeoxyribonuclease RuvC [Lentisphaerota bacterium]MBT5612616.1 crossover junction endodeoxyribonuclease RuvC [Lentisphaerota bacterium]MBT7059275.1 crossover junction endodeoxyribonuclease RuvC [Lentisphaerota bacterium]MBT7845794.1 crossover junction endodeoxyribonuclease RuvC [Lentisphaerota bacterium]